MRYKIVISYDGSRFYGYQKQDNLRTIQGEVERALSLVCKEEVNVSASGRTDAFVHAKFQVIHFDTNLNIAAGDMINALNATLPDDIYCRLCNRVSESFHARYDVKLKTYQYLINVGEYNPLLRNYVLQYNKHLDIEKMELALKLLVGEHDFTSFTVKNQQRDNYVRKITVADISLKNDTITVTITGNGFLRYMVRTIIGTLIEVGRGNIEVEQMTTILADKNRDSAGPTISGCGLYLSNVFY